MIPLVYVFSWFFICLKEMFEAFSLNLVENK